MKKDKIKFLRLPVIAQGAEYLVQGHLMRRNILAYRAPTNNEGYDLICIHPDPRVRCRPVRVQVKSRTATDCPREFPLKTKSLDAFDFLIVVFMNVGFFKGGPLMTRAGRKPPQFYTFPASFIRQHHQDDAAWPKVRLGTIKIDRYKDEQGFELIATKLRIPYPVREP
jgi:hypothetical protein